MQAFRKNPETGFLESNNVTLTNRKHTAFTSDIKLRFFELVNQTIDQHEYPAIDAICRAVGVTVWTFESHLKIDDVFRAEWNNCKRRLLTVFTDKLAFKANQKMGTLANIAMLRYLESGTWIQNEGRGQISSDSTEEKKLINAKHVFLDAEVVEDGGNSVDKPKSIEDKASPSE